MINILPVTRSCWFGDAFSELIDGKYLATMVRVTWTPAFFGFTIFYFIYMFIKLFADD